MKHKLFVVLVLVSLLVTSSGRASAQGPTPPKAADDPRTLLENSYWLYPSDRAETATMKAKRNELVTPAIISDYAPAIETSSNLVTATTPIVNGDFEQGQYVGWSESSINGRNVVVPYTPPGVPTHSGSWIAWLGEADSEVTTLYQSNIAIAAPTTLRLWYWTGSGDSCGFDFFYLKINNDYQAVIDLCYSTNTYGWVPMEINLDAYNGQTVSLRLEVITDDSIPSGILIDDISLYSTFADVPVGYWSEGFIHRLYTAGVTSGCGTSPLLYCPNTTVTRDQMAVFLLRAKNGPGYSPPAVGTSTGFGDVPISHWAAPWIEALAAEGITGGCGGGNYCPSTPVTRDQMAVFLLRAKHGSGYGPPLATGDFQDVPMDHWAAAWIEQLAAEGITGGCGTGIYCPATPVTRDQMAVFLVRTFNLP